jgi:hypothetical protein
MNASEQITRRIDELDDWRGKLLARVRRLILATDPAIVEEWKWDTPVWARNGNVVAAGPFQDHVKINFFKGASLPDPLGLFNAGLEAKASRAIDLYEGDTLNEAALKALVQAAVAANSGAPKTSASARRTKTKAPAARKKSKK